MSIQAVEQSLNKYLLHQNDTYDPLDDEVRNLIEAIAFYILKKENQSPLSYKGVPTGYLPTKAFVARHKWITETALWVLNKIHPEGDFLYRYKKKLYFNPEKTLEAFKNYSPSRRKQLEKLEREGKINFYSC